MKSSWPWAALVHARSVMALVAREEAGPISLAERLVEDAQGGRVEPAAVAFGDDDGGAHHRIGRRFSRRRPTMTSPAP
ncbi:hypothetical protein ACFVUY_37075 [Kitasatospora sp. NPDC058063]|uniref:hypothetical protein n=1 Tax=unclassified Kitasatospora TaxID=2633591 RepID=UPI0036DF85D9